MKQHQVFENIRSILENRRSLSQGFNPYSTAEFHDARGMFFVYFDATVLQTLSLLRLVASRKVRPSNTKRAFCSFYEK